MSLPKPYGALRSSELQYLLLLPILHHDAEADGPADEDEREDDGPDAHARLGSNAGSGGATCRFGNSEPRFAFRADRTPRDKTLAYPLSGAGICRCAIRTRHP